MAYFPSSYAIFCDRKLMRIPHIIGLIYLRKPLLSTSIFFYSKMTKMLLHSIFKSDYTSGDFLVKFLIQYMYMLSLQFVSSNEINHS